jgi:UDP-N-acetylmuramoyl-L-alanyl-D-glutamate--2,6-diaminopimelate ligase/UDP-N-acetylmuramoyl-tripeptide--D-alanyl-D-alanine ligase
MMHALWETLPAAQRGLYAEASSGLADRLREDLRAGDVIMIKGSLGSRMGPLVEALKQDYAAADETVAV